MREILINCFTHAEKDRMVQQNHNEAMRDTWHGDIQTSTDTLVPIDDPSIHNKYPLPEEAAGELIAGDTLNQIKDVSVNPVWNSIAINNIILNFTKDFDAVEKSADVPAKSSPVFGCRLMDESILIQPEFQRMDISNIGNMKTNGAHNSGGGGGVSMTYRRRRYSANSRQENIQCNKHHHYHDSERYGIIAITLY